MLNFALMVPPPPIDHRSRSSRTAGQKDVGHELPLKIVEVLAKGSARDCRPMAVDGQLLNIVAHSIQRQSGSQDEVDTRGVENIGAGSGSDFDNVEPGVEMLETGNPAGE